MSLEAQTIVQYAISYSDYQEYGCPYCLTGQKQGFIQIQTADASSIRCAYCGVVYTVCADSVTESPLMANGKKTPVVNHPLKGKDNV